MTHWRSMYDNQYLGSWDLPEGRDCVVVIEKVKAAKVGTPGEATKAKSMPIVFFVGKEKGFLVNKTNGKAIAGIYGMNCDAWAGKPIALYVTQTRTPEGVMPCIRVRPTAPKVEPPAK